MTRSTTRPIGFARTPTLPAPLPPPITVERLRPTFRRVLGDRRSTEWDAYPLAVPGSAGVGTWLDEIAHPSPVLAEQSSWDHQLGDLFDEMADKDLEMAGLFRKLHDAVTALDRKIEPGDDTTDAHDAAELCRWALSQIRGLDDWFEHLLWSSYYGVVFSEVVWDRVTSGPWRHAVVPVDLVDRPMRRFGFRRRDQRLIVRRPDGDHRLPPPGKILAYRRGSKDTPWGRADADRLYWPVQMTLHGDAMYALHIERRVDPLPRVAHPRDADDTMRAHAERVVRALQQGDGIAYPEGLDIGYLESALSGSVSYPAFLDHYAKRKAIYILTEPQTPGYSGETGAYKSFEISKGFFVARVQKHARSLAAWVKDELLATITALNFGPHVAAPRLRIDVSEAADHQLRMEALGLWRELRLDVPESAVYRALLAHPPRPGEQPFAWPDNRSLNPADAERDPEPDAEPTDAEDETTEAPTP